MPWPRRLACATGSTPTSWCCCRATRAWRGISSRCAIGAPSPVSCGARAASRPGSPSTASRDSGGSTRRCARSRPGSPSSSEAHPLLGLPGVGVLTAAKLIAETGDVRRFRSPDAFAALAGVAPIPASSGQTSPDATEPRRESPAQSGAPYDRDRPGRSPRSRAGVSRPQADRAEDQTRSDPSAQAAVGADGLPDAPRGGT